MSDDMFFEEYDNLVEFVAEFIMVYEAAKIHPQVYINWYDGLSDDKKLFLSDIRNKQIEFGLRVAMLEEEAKKFEEGIIDEVNSILNDKKKK